LTLKALRSRSLVIPALIYNLYFSPDPYLAGTSLRDILRIFGPIPVLEVGDLSGDPGDLEEVKEFLLNTPGLRP